MKRVSIIAALLGVLLIPGNASAQNESSNPTVLTLDQAIQIALSENIAVRVADKDIERAEYAKKGTYAALFPQLDGSASYSRTIKKQVMYMDFDMGSLGGFGSDEAGTTGEDPETKASGGSSRNNGGGIEVGRSNTYSAGVQAVMPLVNAQLWKSLKISGQDVELAVERARSSRLETVTQVKQAYFGVLLAKEAFNVYREVYENALHNFEQTEKRYLADKASELEYQRAKSTVQNAIPNVYDSENAIVLGLWQLKAVMGIDLDEDIDVAGSLKDFSQTMMRDIVENEDVSLERNSNLRQLSIQAEELANTVKMQQYASLPTLALSFSYSINAMANDFKFNTYRWSPYSAAGLSLSVPIFAGGRRANAVKQTRNQHEQLLLQTENTERQLRVAIRQYLNQMETAMKTFSAAEAGVETARKAYEIAEKSYNLGRSTITELNDAQLGLTQAQLAQSQAIYNFEIAKANLEQVLGHDFES